MDDVDRFESGLLAGALGPEPEGGMPYFDATGLGRVGRADTCAANLERCPPMHGSAPYSPNW